MARAQFIELDRGKGASLSGLHPVRISIALTNVTIFYCLVNKEQQTQTFHASIWLIIEPQIDANEKAEQGADGEAEEAP